MIMDKREWLVKLRECNGLTQTEVSEIIGIERSTYTKAELGYPVSVKTAKQIADYYQINRVVFFK